MPIIEVPIREDDRTISRLRRRTLELPRSQRRIKRQASTSLSVASSESESSDDGESSDDEKEKEMAETKMSQITSQSASMIGQMPTSTLAMPTSNPSTLMTSVVYIISTTATDPRHLLSPFPTQRSTKSPTTTTTGLIFNPTAEAVQDSAPSMRPAQTRQHKTLSHNATIALEIVGIATSILVALGTCFVAYRAWKKKKARLYSDDSQPPASMRGGWGNIWKERSKPLGDAAPPAPHGFDGDNAVNRQERLGLVRTSLLGEKELNGGLMKSHSRNNSLSIDGDGTSIPKAFLRKNSATGQMVMEKSAHIRSNSKNGNGRLQIEASGQWDDPVTVARRSEVSQTRGSSGVGVGPGVLPPKAHKPTARAAQEDGEYVEGEYGWNADPYRMSELSTVRDGISPSERGSAIFSAWKGQERERYRRDRESKATTIAKWQSPMSWVKDQVERSGVGTSENGSGGLGVENREKKGMTRLPN